MRVKIDGWAWLRADEMDSVQGEYLRKKLSLVQYVPPEYRKRKKKAGQDEATIVNCFVENQEDGTLGIAREFFYKHARRDHKIEFAVSHGGEWPDRLSVEDVGELVDDNGNPIDWASARSEDEKGLTFFDTQPQKGKLSGPVQLKDEQLQAQAVVLQHLRAREAAGGIVQAPTGWGKTVFCLSLIHELRVKTAVLVHREFLRDQWRKRINRFLPDAKVGLVQGKKWDVDDCHIVLVMIGTLASWVKRNTVPEGFGDLFGLVISDEVHRVSAPTWSPVIPLFNAAKRVGVSARPKRSDGLEKVFLYHIGPKIFTGTQFQMLPQIRRVWSEYEIKPKSRGGFNVGLMSKEMALRIAAASPIYNRDVVSQILLAMKAGRHVIVFTETLRHLQRLRELFEREWKGRELHVDYYIGGMTPGERDRAEEADLLFATYQMCKDALDVPPLDTVVLASPIRNPEQPVGRILREYEGKKQPVVVDMRVDAIPIFKEYGEARDKHYRRLYPETLA